MVWRPDPVRPLSYAHSGSGCVSLGNYSVLLDLHCVLFDYRSDIDLISTGTA